MKNNNNPILYFLVGGIIFFVVGVFTTLQFTGLTDTNSSVSELGKISTGTDTDSEILPINKELEDLPEINTDAPTKVQAFYRALSNMESTENYAEYVIKEFEDISSLEEFQVFEDNYGSGLMAYLSIKIGNKELFLKHFKFKFEDKNLKYPDENWIFTDNIMNQLSIMYNAYQEQGYYDELGYIDDDGSADYFRLSLLSDSLEEKKEKCNLSFSQNRDEFNGCIQYSILMSANIENSFCEELEHEYDKRLCRDSLKLLNDGI